MTEKNKQLITNEVKGHIDDAMERYVVSKYNEWSGLMADIKRELVDQRGDIKEIKDQISPLLNDAQFWGQFWTKVRAGGNILIWTVGVIAAFLILTRQAKVILLAWLGNKIF
jgi:hypothetical protein